MALQNLINLRVNPLSMFLRHKAERPIEQPHDAGRKNHQLRLVAQPLREFSHKTRVKIRIEILCSSPTFLAANDLLASIQGSFPARDLLSSVADPELRSGV
jgi:hypothetical protein